MLCLGTTSAPCTRLSLFHCTSGEWPRSSLLTTHAFMCVGVMCKPGQFFLFQTSGFCCEAQKLLFPKYAAKHKGFLPMVKNCLCGRSTGGVVVVVVVVVVAVVVLVVAVVVVSLLVIVVVV